MWALRRASNPLKGRSFIFRTLLQISYPNSQLTSRNLYEKANNGDSHKSVSHKCMCLKSSHCSLHGFSKFSLYAFSTQADSKNSNNENDDLEDGFSELENNEESSNESEKESNSEQELSEEENESPEELSNSDTKESRNGLLVSNSEELVPEKKSPKKRVSLELFNAIIEAPGTSVRNVMDKWVKDGKELNHSEISVAMFHLRKRNMYGKALQFSEWLESNNPTEFGERGYASRVDLIAKVHGLHAAENYIEKIPILFKTEVIYRTFLACCVISSTTSTKKSEAVFNKMKELNFPLSSFSCNQMLLLYKKTDKKKVADILLLMEKENVKPTLFTYRILVDMKGELNDIKGMEQIIEMMENEGIKPDTNVNASLARHYLNAGFKEKAEAVMREMKGENLSERKWVCNVLLPLYALLGRADEVARVWKACESTARLEDCIAAIIAWGKIGKIEEAEGVFERMTKITKRLNSKHYSPLLRVYANHKMVTKGTDLVKRMSEMGCSVGPHTWHDLVRLYILAGEVEKADSVLEKAAQQTQIKPLIGSYMAIMDQYAKKGDVFNAEKIFYKLRKVGYMGQIRQYETLIRAYFNANEPAYGIRDRMKGDNIFPNNVVGAMLAKVDPFRKTPVSDLLD